MRKPSRQERAQRSSLYEAMEPRLVMTAQPFETDLSLQVVSQPEPPAPVTEIQQSALAQTGLIQAKTDYGFTGAGQTVAVIDTGVAYDHPALGNGFGAGHRVVGGWDFAENDANPYDDGPMGSHGTHVAGIIGSSDATYPGVAPGADIVALRVFDDQGNGNFAWVDQALQWVHVHRNDYANPITAVNLSLGTAWNSMSVPSWAMLETDFAQLKSDGIFIAVAAGNSFQQYGTPGLSYPAASPYVVPVMSEGASGNLSSFSQRAQRAIAAPGEAIMSTVPDYRGNWNGKTDDFAAYSGTSMASPYVAGSSVLLRQAYAFIGQTNVNEDTIYNLMRSTADSVFDPATAQSYLKLNVGRALASIMPADEFGNTVSTAASLGSISSTSSISGVIGKLSDQDFFSFTASQAGTMTVATDVLRGAMHPSYVLGGATGNVNGNSLTFSVQAGQTYTLGLGGSNALGFYKLNFKLDAAAPSAVNWGTIEQKQVLHQRVGPQNQFAMTAVRDGTLTIQASFNHAAGNVDFQLYDAAGKLLGSSASLTNNERIDVTVKAGQTVYLRSSGQNSDVNFTVTDLVSVSGNVVTINGTTGNDAFTFAAGSNNVVTVNGVSYSWAAGQRTFNFVGRGGADSATFTGGAGADTVNLRPGAVDMTGVNYRATTSGVATVVVSGGGGNNTANFFDSAGNDTFVGRPTDARLTGAGFDNTARGFGVVKVTSSGGADQATLYDSAGNDTFIGRPTVSRLTGAGFDITATRFTSVQVIAGGGYDSASLYDSTGNDTFVGSSTSARLSGAGYSMTATNFDRVRVYGTGGANQASVTTPAGAMVSNRTNSFTMVGGCDLAITNFGTVRIQAAAQRVGTRSLGLDSGDFSAALDLTAAQQAAFAQWAATTGTWGSPGGWLGGLSSADAENQALDAFFRRLGRGR